VRKAVAVRPEVDRSEREEPSKHQQPAQHARGDDEQEANFS
jgi:hypothetical protein